MRPSIEAAAALVALGLSTALVAAEPPAPKTPSRMLSRTELRACLVREDDLNKRQDALTSAGAEQQAALEVLGQQAKVLAEALRTLDNTDAAAVDAFNKRNDERNVAVERHNARAAALNQAVTALQEDSADYFSTCVSRPFLLKDRDALLKELGRAPRAKPAAQPASAPPLVGRQA
jgi:hypothetical protein